MQKKWDLLYERYKHLMQDGDTASASFTNDPPFVWSSSKEFLEAIAKELPGKVEESDMEFGGWYLYPFQIN